MDWISLGNSDASFASPRLASPLTASVSRQVVLGSIVKYCVMVLVGSIRQIGMTAMTVPSHQALLQNRHR